MFIGGFELKQMIIREINGSMDQCARSCRANFTGSWITKQEAIMEKGL